MKSVATYDGLRLVQDLDGTPLGYLLGRQTETHDDGKTVIFDAGARTSAVVATHATYRTIEAQAASFVLERFGEPQLGRQVEIDGHTWTLARFTPDCCVGAAVRLKDVAFHR